MTNKKNSTCRNVLIIVRLTGYYELPPLLTALLPESAGETWFRTGVPMTTSSRGCRGGLDLEGLPISVGSRLPVERAFRDLSSLATEAPGKDRDRRSCLGMGRSRE